METKQLAPIFAEVEAACQKAGLQAASLLVVSGMVTDADAMAFGRPLPDSLAATRQAGYDMTGAVHQPDLIG